ncbi:MAG: histidinol-phosphate transaminase [Clostridiales bacterium]|jgi:histidinol-phosphate aminotransferase|nr:histidinol-phosphate transaminase [Clostridiales bacterium]
MIKQRKALEKIKAYIPGKPAEDVERELGISGVVKLASNESSWGPSERAIQAYRNAADGLAVYPDGSSAELTTALCKKFGLKPENIAIGCGSDEIMYLIAKAYINEGDECVTADVTFSTYSLAVESMGGVMRYVPLKNYAFDLDGILGAITPRTRLIFIANPNNPTGAIFTHAEQEAFVERLPRDVVVVFDEAYAEFTTSLPYVTYPDTLAMMKKHPGVILCKTFSKIYGLAALRVGYAAASPEIAELLNRIRPPFNVNSAAQKAAAAALRDEGYIAMVADNNKQALDFLDYELDKMGVRHIPSAANFVLIDTERDADEVFQALMREGYIVRSGKPFGMDTFIRVSTGKPAQMAGFIEKFRKVMGIID